jgi:YVTN family beta-propeller protein
MSTIPVAGSVKRQLAAPIDIDTVFTTTAARTAYLGNALRYPGMIVSDEQTNKMYYLSADSTTWIVLLNGVDGANFATNTMIPLSNRNTVQSGIHGTAISATNQLYCGSIVNTTGPGLICYNDPNDLTNYTVIRSTLNLGAGSMVYDAVNNKVYVSNNTSNVITIIDCATNTYIDQVVTGLASGPPAPGMATDGTYLYVASGNIPIVIYKIQISTWTLTASASLTGSSVGHSMQLVTYSNGQELIITGTGNSLVFTVDPATLLFSSYSLLNGTLWTDDFCYFKQSGNLVATGIWFWLGSELGGGI